MLGGGPIVNIVYLPILRFCLGPPVWRSRRRRCRGSPAPLPAPSLRRHCECRPLTGSSKTSAAKAEGCPSPGPLLRLPDGPSASSAGARTLCWFCHLCEQTGGVRGEGGIPQRLKAENAKVKMVSPPHFFFFNRQARGLVPTHPALSRYVLGDTERCTENSCHPHLLPCLCKGGAAVPSWQGVG